MELREILSCGYYEEDKTYVVEIQSDKFCQYLESIGPIGYTELLDKLKEEFDQSDSKDFQVRIV